MKRRNFFKLLGAALASPLVGKFPVDKKSVQGPAPVSWRVADNVVTWSSGDFWIFNNWGEGVRYVNSPNVYIGGEFTNV